MKEKKLYAVLSMALLAVVVAGCIGGGETQAPAGGTETAAQEAQETGGATVAAEATEQPTTEQPTTQETGLAGMDYVQLLALGTPVECTVSVTQDGTVHQGKIYMKSGKTRYEGTTVSEGQTFDSVSIFKENAVYTSVLAGWGEMFADCDWLKMSATPSQEEQQYQGTSEETMEEIPPVDFECHAAVFGDEKFATANECDLNDILGGAIASAMPSMPSEMEACEGLTGLELIECMQQQAT